MKTTITAGLAALLLPAGLVAGATTAASGAGPTGPGEPEYDAVTAVGLEAKAPHRAKVYVKVNSPNDEKPLGMLDLTFVKNDGTSFEFSRPYPKQADGDRRTYNFEPLPRGKLTVIVDYTPTDETSVASSDATTVRVKGARR